jgi:hypothetical protein
MQRQFAAAGTEDELRAEVARYRVPVYMLAARLRVHPTRLSRLLHGRERIPEALVPKILDAIRAEAVAR